MNGIDVKYSLNPDYFEEGKAYEIRVATNDFRIGLLTKYSEDSVTFKIWNGGDVVDFTLTLDELRFREQWIIKMKPDYGKGKFSSDME